MIAGCGGLPTVSGMLLDNPWQRRSETGRRSQAYHLVVMTPLSGRITQLPVCATYLKVIDAPPNRTPAMFDVVDSVTSSNSLTIDAQNRPSSAIKFPATQKRRQGDESTALVPWRAVHGCTA